MEIQVLVLFFICLDTRHHNRADELREINWVLTKKMQTGNCYKRCALLGGDNSLTCRSTPSPFSKLLEKLTSDDKRNTIKKFQNTSKLNIVYMTIFIKHWDPNNFKIFGIVLFFLFPNNITIIFWNLSFLFVWP